MDKKKTHQFTKYFIYILLIGQLWSHVFSYANFLFDMNDNHIELTSAENEIDKKKDFDDKIISSYLYTFSYNDKLSTNFNHEYNLSPINFLKINTSPPKYL